MNLKSICLMLLTAIIMASCGNDDESASQPQEAVTLEMTSGVIKNNSAAVKVTASQNEAEYYIHLFTQEEYQTHQANLVKKMQELAAADQADLAKGKCTRIYTDLQPLSKYVACAMPVGKGGENEVKTVEFTTTDKELPEMEVREFNLVNDGDWMENGTTNFRMMIINAEYSDETWYHDGAVVQLFALTDWMDDVPGPDFFPGIYTSAAEGEENEVKGTIVNRNSSYTLYGDEYVYAGIEKAEFAIAYEGDEYVVSGICKTDKGYEFSVYYKGGYQYKQAGFYGYKSYEPQLDRDLTGLDYPLMKAAYYLDKKDGVGRYHFAMVNNPDDTDIYGGVNKHCINVMLLAPLPKYPMLEFPEGTYTIQEGDAPFTAIPGDYKRYTSNQFGGYGSYYYYLDDTGVTNVQTDGFLRAGTVKVSREDEEYVFEIDATTNRGFKVSGTFKGTFEITLDSFENI